MEPGSGGKVTMKKELEAVSVSPCALELTLQSTTVKAFTFLTTIFQHGAGRGSLWVSWLRVQITLMTTTQTGACFFVCLFVFHLVLCWVYPYLPTWISRYWDCTLSPISFVSCTESYSTGHIWLFNTCSWVQFILSPIVATVEKQNGRFLMK